MEDEWSDDFGNYTKFSPAANDSKRMLLKKMFDAGVIDG